MSIINKDQDIVADDDLNINDLRKKLFSHYSGLPIFFSMANDPTHFNIHNNDLDTIKYFLEYLDNSHDEINNKIEILQQNAILNDIELQKQISDVEALKKENKKIKEGLFYYIEDKENDLAHQYLNIDIYIDTNDSKKIFNTYSAVLDLLKSIDFESFIELDAVKGSWWKRFSARSTEPTTKDDVKNKLESTQYGLEVEILKSQSEIDKNQSEALANIMVSLKDIPDAAIRIGSLLVVKTTNPEGEVSLVVQTLSINQLQLINKNPNLIAQPKSILDRLSFLSENNEDNYLN
ncbi:hypothetical protein [Chryseobacterium gleum]|uniref:hypothetical protein n=1 Tax=Chryseobacterium gleum TaxID=250 RepID=UPI001E330AC1|nr:hypothetical protein [Chryseobacterium gleum]MCD9616660.1 hypothetical protein [Chryseobacterium gleum]